MTRDEVLLMPAGKALDDLIAAQVMGWRRGVAPVEMACYWYDVVTGATGRQPCMDTDDYYRPEAAWSPSTDMNAAWEAVEAVRAKFPPDPVRHLYDDGPWFQVQTPSPSRQATGATYFAGWARGRDYEGEGFLGGLHAGGETPALVICRAALLAVLEVVKS